MVVGGGRCTVVIPAHKMHGDPGSGASVEPGLKVGLSGAPGAERAVEKISQDHEPFTSMGFK
jgi:hypothetical protein